MNEQTIFTAALEREPGERSLFLDEVCGADQELRQRVEKLLRLHADAGNFLDSPVADSSPTLNQAGSEKPGTQIGPYKLLQQIGEGGMGVVWMAEQTQPVQRKVALKVIKPGMDSRQVIARFEAERQALAMMDHVNIARVLDAGTTDSGLPYFVMELVHGVPITQYCDDIHLTPRERLELFVPVCQAIQHAHQKGIIHRDIKPSNVMITLYDGKPVPKVIDFGVAKATEQTLTERTLFTQYGTMVGTLEYMSPEQAEMSALGVDTRSDIYSLGVLLYELLTGSTPLTHKRMKEAAYAEVLRLIKEEEPPKPSTRLSDSGEALASISAQRHMEPAKLTKLVRGELDWIVMKTLDKDRNRRYETANALAAEVQNYLNDETVLACPPSAGYRFRKFTRRNKAPLAFTGLVLLILLTVTGGIGWNVRDRAARQTAVEQEVKLAFKAAEEWQEQGKWAEALSAAKLAEGLLAGGGSDELRERVHQLRKDLDMVLRLDDIRLLSSEWKDDKFDFESADQAYAQAFADYGIDVARLPANEAAARIRGRPGVAIALAAALDDWAFSRSRKDKAGSLALTAVAQSADSDPWRRQVRETHKQNDDKALAALIASPELLRQPPTTLEFLARTIGALGNVEREIELLRPAQRQYPGDFWINLQLASALGRLAPLYRDEAVSFNRAALAARPQSIAAHNDLGFALSRQGKLDEAIDTYRRAIELDPKFTRARINLGEALQKQGKVDEAIDWCRKTINLDPKSAAGHIALSNALVDRKKLPEAIDAYHKAIELDPKYAHAYNGLGNALSKQKKLPEAIDAYHKAIELDPKDALAYNGLGNALSKQKKLPEAIDAYHKAIELDPKYAQAYNGLGNALCDQNKLPEAIDAYHKAIELDPKDALAYNGLGNALCDQKKLPKAIDAYHKAIELDPKYAHAYIGLGYALSKQKKLPEAIDAYHKAIELDPKEALAYFNLSLALQSKGRVDEAIAAFEEVIRRQPDFTSAQFGLASALAEAKQWDRSASVYAAALKRFGASQWPGPWYEAIRSDEVFTRLTAQQPDDRLPRIMRARLYVLQRDWKRAAADYARVNESWLASIDPAKLLPEGGDDLFGYGCLLLLLDDRRGYEQFCKQWADRVGDAPAWGYDLARAWAVSARPVVPAQQIVERARKTLQASRAPCDLHVLSLAHYRNGEFELAIECAEESNGGDWPGSLKALNWLVLAMAHSRLGHAAEACKSLQQALKLAGRASPEQLPGVAWPDMAPPDIVECELLRREAEQLINPKSQEKPDKK